MLGIYHIGINCTLIGKIELNDEGVFYELVDEVDDSKFFIEYNQQSKLISKYKVLELLKMSEATLPLWIELCEKL